MGLRIVLGTFILLFALIVSGCGGGGGGGSTASSGSSADDSGTTIVGPAVSGVASKGIIVSGTVRIYAVTEQGQKGALLGSGTTDANGRYKVGFGDYQGALLVEVSGGRYVDEATGVDLTIPRDQPLRALVHDASDDLVTAVTPLTELAVLLAEQSGDMSPERIMMANAQISHFFGVDIVSVMPVLVDGDGFGGGDFAQQNYSLLLAAISQMMENDAEVNVAELLAQLLEQIRSRLGEAEYGAVNGEMPESFDLARNQFLADHDAAQDDLEHSEQQQFDDVRAELGYQTVILKLVGNAQVYGVKVMLSLPEGSCEEVVESAEDDRTLHVRKPLITMIGSSDIVFGLYDFNSSYVHQGPDGRPLINLAMISECPLPAEEVSAYYDTMDVGVGSFAFIAARLPVDVVEDDINIMSVNAVDRNGVEIDTMTIGVDIETVDAQYFDDVLNVQ